ncbi:MAG: pyrroloquinoline quinone biosynthesis peptide chaperone PqqD [Nitrospira sp.]|nr:pyrroloquinoline quinone biosynthesis peptide chaperone PqqD [Nitrospira sp.]
MFDPIVRPRLSPKARLRFDRRTGRYLLLYPEAGLDLNDTGSDILQRCTGDRTTDDIIQELADRHGGAAPAEIARDVRAFVMALADRGLIQDAE